MGGLHWYDLLVVFGLALLFFGPKRLPEMGSAVGKTIKEFQKSMREVTEPEKPSTTPAALPQADAQVQTTPQVAAPAENAAASASPAQHHLDN